MSESVTGKLPGNSLTVHDYQAHFLEHLLFMGSEKYPGENEYESFVSRHGGSDNAYTEWEHTTYSLEIPQEFLWPALDRLAQHFVSPLLLESAVERELKSIESEFELHKNSDGCRRQQLLCSTSKKGHPIAKFGWGNLKSLSEIPKKNGVEPLKEMRSFFNQYYYGANMRVAVIGAYTLDELEAKVTKIFSPIPKLPRENGPYALPIDPSEIGSWNVSYRSPLLGFGLALEEQSLGTIFRIVPVKDRQSLSLTWQLPPQFENWKSKPSKCRRTSPFELQLVSYPRVVYLVSTGDFLSHLLGHEAPGSLFSLLRDQGLVVSCMAGIGDEGSEFASTHALFTFTFNLTEKGMAEWRSIVEKVYEYIGILRYYSEKGWPEWIYEELQGIHDLAYRFQSESSPDEVVDEIVDNMAPHLMIPPERLLDGNSLLFEFRSDLVHEILEKYFTPTNCRIELTSSSYGRAADFKETDFCGTTMIRKLTIEEDSGDFHPSTASPPQVEPMFGTRFWCHSLQQKWLNKLASARDPKPSGSELFLPPRNQFVPENLTLMPLPANDSRHILLNSSIKLCIVVGKTKQWLPGLVLQYDQTRNAVLVSFEDEDEVWHTLDDEPGFFIPENISAGFEGTMDKKKIKFKVLSLSLTGKPRRLLGDESDLDVLEGKGFPPVDPPAPAHRLPRSICDTNTLKLWWMQDRTFHRPFAELRMQIVCLKANASPLHQACAELMVQLCLDSLTGTRYQAELCELFASLSVTDTGFSLRIHGFNDKMKALLHAMLSTVLSFRKSDTELPPSICKDRFDVCLEIQRRSYNNTEMTSSGQASSIRMKALRPTVWSVNQKSKAMNCISIRVFCQTIHEVFSEVSVESLLHGNFDHKGAEDVKTLILSLLKESGPCDLPRKLYPAQSVLRIPASVTSTTIVVPSKDPQEPNTAVELYLQIGKDNLRERTLIDLLVHIMDEPMFDQLRTKDQFGYDVSCSERWSWGITGILFKVVTSVKSAEEVVDRVDRFLAEFRETLSGMSKEAFHSHVVAVAQQKLDMFNSLSEETNSYWGEIVDGRFEWQAWRSEALELRSITKDDVMQAFDKWLKPGTPRNMLVVKVIGTGESDCSKGRPDIDPEDVEEFCDSEIGKFHEKCKKQYWGRVNSKLF